MTITTRQIAYLTLALVGSSSCAMDPTYNKMTAGSSAAWPEESLKP